jgi:ATP adenylyltransferase
MKRIWSPWRMKYIMQQNHKPGCIFCQALEQRDGPENLVVYRGKKAFVILNRYPYTSGHLMIVPNVHLPALSVLDMEVQLELIGLIARAEQVLRFVYNPEGFNISMLFRVGLGILIL